MVIIANILIYFYLQCADYFSLNCILVESVVLMPRMVIMFDYAGDDSGNDGDGGY